MSGRGSKLLVAADEWKLGLGVSLFLHALLLLLFALFRVGYEFTPPEFVEMTFVSARAERSAATAAPAQPARQTPQRAAAAEKAARGREAIALPKRRMLEEEEPVVRASDEGKLTPAEAPQVIVPEQVAEASGKAPVDEKLLREPGGKIAPELPTAATGSKPVARQSPRRGTQRGEPFVITGEAARRTILYKVIPEYPEGLNKEAVVRIRFTVLPSGLVGRAVLVTKGGDATLERLTLDAFRQWRFNPLPPDVPQVEQEGVITFRWILR